MISKGLLPVGLKEVLENNQMGQEARISRINADLTVEKGEL